MSLLSDGLVDRTLEEREELLRVLELLEFSLTFCWVGTVELETGIEEETKEEEERGVLDGVEESEKEGVEGVEEGGLMIGLIEMGMIGFWDLWESSRGTKGAIFIPVSFSGICRGVEVDDLKEVEDGSGTPGLPQIIFRGCPK